jgi:hypothetical protein
MGVPPQALIASRVLASHPRSEGRGHQAKEPIIPLLSCADAEHFVTRPARNVVVSARTISGSRIIPWLCWPELNNGIARFRRFAAMCRVFLT